MSERSERGDFTAEARRIGHARAASLDGLDLAVEGLDRLADSMGGPPMKDLIEEHTEIMFRDVQSRAPKGRFGQYIQAIKKKVFDNLDGFVGTVFVIQGPWERDPGKKWPKNVPLWIEYGTRKMDPRPHLIPALNAAKERFSRAVERLLEGAVSS